MKDNLELRLCMSVCVLRECGLRTPRGVRANTKLVTVIKAPLAPQRHVFAVNLICTHPSHPFPLRQLLSSHALSKTCEAAQKTLLPCIKLTGYDC